MGVATEGMISDAVAEGITGVGVPIGGFLMYKSLVQTVKKAQRKPNTNPTTMNVVHHKSR